MEAQKLRLHLFLSFSLLSSSFIPSPLSQIVYHSKKRKTNTKSLTQDFLFTLVVLQLIIPQLANGDSAAIYLSHWGH
jgi:hypothetical protein